MHTTSRLSKDDHMHHIVDLVRQGPLTELTKALNKSDVRKQARKLSPVKARPHALSTPQSSKGTANTDLHRRIELHREIPKGHSNVNVKFVLPPLATSLPKQPISNHHDLGTSASKKSVTRKDQTFPLLSLPPELRNTVYRLLLTTPHTPIELPRITRDVAIRAREWIKCKNSRSKKARFKSLFLEILETCKQVHDEGSSILYGCNVFKFRSCHSEGPKIVVLPTRHLHLLKNIKVSVISREPHNGQDEWVANLLKTFVKDGMQLETFEMSWYGWRRYHLRAYGLVCHALQLLQAEKQFTIKVLGEARMEKRMAQQLQLHIHSWRVEIHRPINADTGAELSD